MDLNLEFLDSDFDHNASQLEQADSKVEMKDSPPESTQSENETHWIRKPNWIFLDLKNLI